MDKYWNMTNSNTMGYITVPIDYSIIKNSFSNLAKDMINVLKKVDLYFAYKQVESESSDETQMEKEIQEYEESKFEVIN